jgi:hypothetical protein
MTKMDGSLDPAQVTAFYPPGLLVKYEDESGIVYAGPLGLGFDPNAAEWPYTIEGFENDTHGQVIWIFKSLAPARELRVGRHEVGHASDHVNFGPGDHETATPKLMHPNVLDDVFSGPSILHLRGVTP